MWRPFKRGRTAVKGIFKRRWFQRNRVTTIDAENDTDSVASSIDRCNRCECPRSCDCHCHIVAAPSPRNSLPASSQDFHARCPNPSPQACSQSLVFSAQERANQVPADDRGAETPRPCSSTGPAFTPPPPTLDYEKVETSQPPNCLLSASPPDSYLSYASITALHQPPPDCVGKLRLPVPLPSVSPSSRRVHVLYRGWIRTLTASTIGHLLLPKVYGEWFLSLLLLPCRPMRFKPRWKKMWRHPPHIPTVVRLSTDRTLVQPADHRPRRRQRPLSP